MPECAGGIPFAGFLSLPARGPSPLQAGHSGAAVRVVLFPACGPGPLPQAVGVLVCRGHKQRPGCGDGGVLLAASVVSPVSPALPVLPAFVASASAPASMGSPVSGTSPTTAASSLPALHGLHRLPAAPGTPDESPGAGTSLSAAGVASRRHEHRDRGHCSGAAPRAWLRSGNCVSAEANAPGSR